MIEITDVRKRFGQTPVLCGVSLAVPRGTVVALLGPSGCGKTTLLRVLAGLETPDAGRVVIDGTPVNDPAAAPPVRIPPERRGVGLVFQDFALFPHLDVRANVGYGLRGLTQAEIAARVDATLATFDIAELAGRYPHALSGGQQQRVALARALAPGPRVLLMDEPFSNLDASLRRRLRVSLRARLESLGVTTVFVTHDQEEALSMADRVAVMHAGCIAQCDTPQAVYRQPATAAVARATGRVNLVPGRAAGGRFECQLGAFDGVGPDGDALLFARPEDLALTTDAGAMRVRVVGRDYVGAELELWLAPHDAPPSFEPLVARSTEDHPIGAEVGLALRQEARWLAR